KCKWPYNVALYGHATKRDPRLIPVVLVEIRVFRPLAFWYGEQRTALCFFVWPVVEPRFGLEHPEADDVLTAMGFGCKLPAQFIEEPAVFDIRPTVCPINRAILNALPSFQLPSSLRTTSVGLRIIAWRHAQPPAPPCFALSD